MFNQYHYLFKLSDMSVPASHSRPTYCQNGAKQREAQIYVFFFLFDWTPSPFRDFASYAGLALMVAPLSGRNPGSLKNNISNS